MAGRMEGWIADKRPSKWMGKDLQTEEGTDGRQGGR